MTSQDPLISCIVAAYNSDKYVSDALGSILAQTYSTIEVIVADDGSEDDTRNIAAAFDPGCVL